ncbi:MAG TPA: response regulator [Saprospiraceae bacterium]|nr:response regulator [Saprospiraceae bacterium]
MPKNNIQILLAEDDEDDRLFFLEAMIQTGQNIIVNVAKDGVELMSLLRNEKMRLPDLIFLDLNMPLKNGLECLKEIKSEVSLKDIPVIIFSTSSSQDHIDVTFNYGANLYISKPDSISELQTVLDGIFSNECVDYIPQQEKNKFYFVY